MSYEPYICNLDPESNKILKLYLFKNVQNVEEIRNNVTNGNWKCAVIKPSLILDTFQVAVAANKAVLAEKSQSMVTRTVFSEILYNLSLSKNITQSLSKFGIEKDQNLLVCFLDNADSNESESTIKKIDGEICSISELEKFTNIKDLKSVYKLNNVKSDVDLLDIIVSRIVTKNFVVY
ncbi:unnamed protein product [Parnassius apollo]|uniref:(apollo) hypothetical protein n=1 Tax=Parnassius apollo TaxID=110799 RepID=A0A8S3XLA1_PARAO|nr:unnamed protein product [Parnassius apollo]